MPSSDRDRAQEVLIVVANPHVEVTVRDSLHGNRGCALDARLRSLAVDDTLPGSDPICVDATPVG